MRVGCGGNFCRCSRQIVIGIANVQSELVGKTDQLDHGLRAFKRNGPAPSGASPSLPSLRLTCTRSIGPFIIVFILPEPFPYQDPESALSLPAPHRRNRTDNLVCLLSRPSRHYQSVRASSCPR